MMSDEITRVETTTVSTPAPVVAPGQVVEQTTTQTTTTTQPAVVPAPVTENVNVNISDETGAEHVSVNVPGTTVVDTAAPGQTNINISS
jgi:hypothetical protein